MIYYKMNNFNWLPLNLDKNIDFIFFYFAKVLRHMDSITQNKPWNLFHFSQFKTIYTFHAISTRISHVQNQVLTHSRPSRIWRIRIREPKCNKWRIFLMPRISLNYKTSTSFTIKQTNTVKEFNIFAKNSNKSLTNQWSNNQSIEIKKHEYFYNFYLQRGKLYDL